MGFFAPAFSKGVPVLLAAGALSSGVAYLSGEKQKEIIEKDLSKEDKSALSVHEKLGKITVVSYFILVMLQTFKSLRRFTSFLVLIFPLLLIFTGYFGGKVSH